MVGCTELNDPEDDHAGRGRLLHYDGSLKLKQTIWIDDTTHIVGGLRFAPDRTLWAFDSFAHKVLRYSADGRRLPDFPAPTRAWGQVAFSRDGTIWLGEALIGDKPLAPLKTTLPFLPGTKRFGDGHLFHFDAKGRLLREFATEVHGGMGGFQAISSLALARDERTMFYTSESGPRLMRYDLEGARQLPDLLGFPDRSGKFFFDIAFDPADRLLALRGLTMDALSPQDGEVLRSYALESFGWASIALPVTPAHVYVTNWFSGEIRKIDLASGATIASAQTGAKKALAGVAEAT